IGVHTPQQQAVNAADAEQVREPARTDWPNPKQFIGQQRNRNYQHGQVEFLQLPAAPLQPPEIGAKALLLRQRDAGEAQEHEEEESTDQQFFNPPGAGLAASHIAAINAQNPGVLGSKVPGVPQKVDREQEVNAGQAPNRKRAETDYDRGGGKAQKRARMLFE